MFNDWATITGMAVSDVTATTFTASLTFSVPDLNLEDATASLAYSSDTRNYTFQVGTHSCPGQQW